MARPLPLVAGLLALLFAAETASAARTYTVRVSFQGYITHFGPLRPETQNGATLARASAVFGDPTSVAPVGNGANACRVRWSGLRLRTLFANFGSATACSERFFRLQTATVRSRRFRTWRGLRVGDASSSIRRKHPGAVFRGNRWIIVSGVPRVGEPDQAIPTIEAIVSGGRVRVLRFWVGGAGD